MNVWSKARTRAGALTLLAGVLTVGGTAAAVAAISPASDQTPAGEVYVAPTDTTAATTTDAPAVAAEVPAATTSAPVAPPVSEAPAATVETVTPPAQKPATSPQVVDPESIGTTGADGRYTPAPQQPKPGEPPVLNDPGSEPAPPVRGEGVTVLPAS